MAIFAEPADVQRFCMNQMIKGLDPDVLDERWVYPAERRIEEAFYLDLNTDYYPSAWISMFDNRPVLISKFQADYRRAVIILIDHWANNPHHASSESIGGSSITHRTAMPPEVRSLMTRWGKRPRVVRY